MNRGLVLVIAFACLQVISTCGSDGSQVSPNGQSASVIINSTNQPESKEPGSAKQATEPHFSEYQKEALGSLKELTSNLLFLATGVFALVGGYLVTKDSAIAFAKRSSRIAVIVSFLFFGLSLMAGLVVIMGLIDQLRQNEFDPLDAIIRLGSEMQIVCVAIGAVAFFIFLLSNIRKPGPSSHNSHSKGK